jgi:hypothetical protein
MLNLYYRCVAKICYFVNVLLHDSPFLNTFSKYLLRKHVKWPVYKQSLVRRDEILIAFDVIDNWDTELKDMNKDNVGLGTISLS